MAQNTPTYSSTTGSAPSTLSSLLWHRAEVFPDRIAFEYARDGVDVSARLTYSEIEAQTTRWARAIGAACKPYDRALLLFPPGLDFIAAFFGCLRAGVIAVPCPLPSKRDTDWERLCGIAQNCNPTALLTLPFFTSHLETGTRGRSALSGLPVLDGDDHGIVRDSGSKPDAAQPDDLAFLQYTSGSTGAPKGVMVSHANLMANLAAIHERFQHGPESRGLIWLPAYHDMGLIGGVLTPVFGAFPVRLMSPMAFLQSPIRWLRAVSDMRATTSGGPNFAYAHVLKKVLPHELDGIDLSSWHVAFTGAEAVQAATLDAFSRLLGPAGFRHGSFLPCYGLAEATLIVTGARAQDSPAYTKIDRVRLSQDRFEPTEDNHLGHTVVSCGPRTITDEVTVVETSTLAVCSEGEIGEVWVRGPSVARGYWGRPELSAETFGATDREGTGPYLRTRDRGCMWRGQLVVTGRSTEMLVVRGRNHYAEDIEAAARESHPALATTISAAFAAEGLDDDGFVVVLELPRGSSKTLSAQEAARVSAERVRAVTGVTPTDVCVVQPGAIPVTSSGKVRRSACRDAYVAGALSRFGVPAQPPRPRP